MASEKFERIAQVKANYDIMLKRLKPETHQEKIDTIKEKKAGAVLKVQNEIDAKKKERVTEIKQESESKKKELIEAKDKALEQLQASDLNRRRTVRHSQATHFSQSQFSMMGKKQAQKTSVDVINTSVKSDSLTMASSSPAQDLSTANQTPSAEKVDL